jgi:glycosyltransferase involved in cell wall biosynthesis
LINNKNNGFLFKIDDSNALARIINDNLNGNKKIQQNAIQTSRKYLWSFLIKRYIKLFNKK